MIIYGRNAVHEALRGRRAAQVGEIWATHGASRESWLQDLQAQIRVRLSTPAEIERRCGSPAHQGVCAEAGGYPYVSAGELLAGGPLPAGGPSGSEPLIVALDEVQDPQNLGSICRTAECVGASGLVITERRAAEVTPAACKASAGAVEHLRIACVRNLADFLGHAREAGCWCYGAAASVGEDLSRERGMAPCQRGMAPRERGMAPRERGTVPSERPASGERSTSCERSPSRERPASRGPIPYDTPDYRGAGVVLVLGSEGRGLRPRVAKACDELIALPMRGRIDSLNVSAAAAALLYEILRARGG